MNMLTLARQGKAKAIPLNDKRTAGLFRLRGTSGPVIRELNRLLSLESAEPLGKILFESLRETVVFICSYFKDGSWELSNGRIISRYKQPVSAICGSISVKWMLDSDEKVYWSMKEALGAAGFNENGR